MKKNKSPWRRSFKADLGAELRLTRHIQNLKAKSRAIMLNLKAKSRAIMLKDQVAVQVKDTPQQTASNSQAETDASPTEPTDQSQSTD